VPGMTLAGHPGNPGESSGGHLYSTACRTADLRAQHSGIQVPSMLQELQLMLRKRGQSSWVSVRAVDLLLDTA
jgi:hypothetical protein